jgi:hypothetical protein
VLSKDGDMRVTSPCRRLASMFLLAALAACGGGTATPERQAVRQEQAATNADQARAQARAQALGEQQVGAASSIPEERSSIFDLFTGGGEPDREIAVNRYLWSASLDILSFLPLEGADPFSGVIATGWGRVGGDPTPFRVTVFISEPALDARSLRVAAFRQQGGRAVAVETADNRRLEDAILTRARQMRIAANNR